MVDSAGDGMTMLMYAAKWGEMAVVELLLSKGKFPW